MGKNIKIILFLSLAILALLFLSNKVYAMNYTYGDFKYTVDSETSEAIIIEYLDKEAEKIVIPETINEHVVTEINYSAFDKCNMTSVEIPHTVKRICGMCFYKCENLKSINIPSSVKIIGDSAFYGCKNLENISLHIGLENIENFAFGNCSSLKSLNIPDTVTKFGKGVFVNCTGLEQVTIPSSITEISERTFKQCTSLKKYVIPNQITKIGASAFSECSELREIVISDNVTEIGTSAFSNCSKLEEIVIPNKVKEMGDTVFYECSKLKKIDLPNSLKIIGESVFVDCNQLESIVIPNSVISMGENNFRYCENLSNITLSSSLKTIPAYEFYHCDGLEEITIPNGVTQIGKCAFSICPNLKTVKLPNTLEIIENEAFLSSNNLKSIIMPESINQVEEFSFNWYNVLFYIKKGSFIEQYILETNRKTSQTSERQIQYKYIDGNDIEIVTKKSGSFKSANRTFSGKYGYNYDDNYFKNKSTTYNHNLATMSLCLAFSAYNMTNSFDEAYKDAEDYNVKKLLSECGFTRYIQHNYGIKPTKNTIGCAIASKEIDGETLIAIAIRGGGYDKEWISNFTVGKTGDHEGFTSASDKVYEYLYDYIKQNNINSLKNVKVWITGFSRAGAVSNLLAAKLDRDAKFVNNNIYAYCFATPAGADKASTPHGKSYNNIFSIISYYDPVPLVAPNFWNFDRYGITKVFAVESFSETDRKYEQRMIDYLKNMGNSTYKIHEFKKKYIQSRLTLSGIQFDVKWKYANIGLFYRELNDVLKTIDKIKTRTQYIDSGTQTMVQNATKKYFDEGIQTIANDIITGNEFRWDVLIDLLASSIIPVGTHISMVDTLYNNCSNLVEVHLNQAYYLASMQSMDDNYVEGIKPYFSEPDYRVTAINCPVDVYVYDSNNKLLATIINEEPKRITEDAPIVDVDENEQKLVYLPKDKKYIIKTKARENCNVTYTVNEYSGVNSKISRIVNYNKIEMKKNEEIISVVNAYSSEEQEKENSSGTSVIYTVEKSNKKINASLDISGNQIEKYTYTVSIKNDKSKGTVTGGGVYTIGEFCQVIAEEKNGYQFIGWYNGSVKVSGDVAYRFAVKNNITLEAKYIPGVKTVKLSKTSFTYNKKVQKPVVTVKDCEGKTLKKGTNYTISYSNKNSKKVGKYTVTVTFKGNYTGSQKLTYQIRPKGVTIKKLTKGKKKFKITWKKNTTETTGYQIQYSIKKNFSSGNKTIKINKNKTTGATVSKLKNKKRYYVRIRTYKKVKGKKIYSGWSKVLNVKTK